MKRAGDGARATLYRHAASQATSDGIALAVKQGGGDALVRLTPQELGTLTLRVRVEGSEVRVHARAEEGLAHELLLQSVPELRASLESQGLRVRELHVTHMPQDAATSASMEGGGASERGAFDAQDAGGGAETGEDRGRHASRDDPGMEADDPASGVLANDAERAREDAVVPLVAGAMQWIA